MVGLIEKTRRAHHVKDGLYMTVAAVDGKRVFAVRYASDHDSPSLYHSKSLHALRELGGKTEDLPDDGLLILSEPLDAVSQHWEKIPDATALVVENGTVTQLPFKPEE
jgi:predicted glutamine amidotransferase